MKNRRFKAFIDDLIINWLRASETLMHIFQFWERGKVNFLPDLNSLTICKGISVSMIQKMFSETEKRLHNLETFTPVHRLFSGVNDGYRTLSGKGRVKLGIGTGFKIAC